MPPFKGVSEDDYLTRERVAATKSELLNGHVVAMAGASLRHNAIVRNLLFALGSRLRGKSCQPYPSDVRIHVPSTGLYTYPDVSVLCAPLERHAKDSATLLNPRLLLEVLSDATEAYDRGAKFAHYRTLTSLQTYVLVAQNEIRIEWYERGADGAWTLHEAVGEGTTLTLRAIDVSCPVAEIYVDLPSE
jgi:Uma2 family endonuclease